MIAAEPGLCAVIMAAKGLEVPWGATDAIDGLLLYHVIFLLVAVAGTRLAEISRLLVSEDADLNSVTEDSLSVMFCTGVETVIWHMAVKLPAWANIVAEPEPVALTKPPALTSATAGLEEGPQVTVAVAPAGENTG
jgi:hypothetical protein